MKRLLMISTALGILGAQTTTPPPPPQQVVIAIRLVDGVGKVLSERSLPITLREPVLLSAAWCKSMDLEQGQSTTCEVSLNQLARVAMIIKVTVPAGFAPVPDMVIPLGASYGTFILARLAAADGKVAWNFCSRSALSARVDSEVDSPGPPYWVSVNRYCCAAVDPGGCKA